MTAPHLDAGRLTGDGVASLEHAIRLARAARERDGRSVEVVGPVGLPSAAAVHEDFWTGEHT